MTVEKSNILYFDRKIGLILYPILGISFIFFANDNDLKELIKYPSFKWDIAFSIVAVAIVGIYLAWLNRYLDKNKKISWESSFSKRLKVQFLFGIFSPLFIVIGLEIFYLKLINIPFGQSSIVNLELPLAFIYLFIINLLYFINYIYSLKKSEQKNSDMQQPVVTSITIFQGSKEIAIPIVDCAFIMSSEKNLWLHTSQNRQIFIHGTMLEWESKLPKKYFYRLNRQYIANRNAIEGVEITNTRRLKIFLKGSGESIFISKANASNFRKWWKS